MYTGIQFTGTLAPNASGRWFTFNWASSEHVVWYVMPTTVKSGAAEVECSVAVERATATTVTYWLTVKNLTNQTMAFEGRYAVLN